MFSPIAASVLLAIALQAPPTTPAPDAPAAVRVEALYLAASTTCFLGDGPAAGRSVPLLRSVWSLAWVYEVRITEWWPAVSICRFRCGTG